MNVSATPRLEYRAYRPPAGLEAWVEAVAILRMPARAPRRRWRRVPDARGRLGLRLDAPGPGPRLEPPRFGPGWVPALPPGAWAVVRFTPWSTGVLGLSDRGMDRWPELAARWRAPGACGAWRGEVAEALRPALEGRRPDPRAVNAWRAFAQNPVASAESVARECGVSGRTLLRAVRVASGCAPRDARNLERLRRTLLRLREDLSLSWTSAALAAGFSDQAHFIRLFGALVGTSPTRFFEEGHHHMNDVFAHRITHGEATPALAAVGDPVLRPSEDRHRLARDGRRGSRT